MDDIMSKEVSIFETLTTRSMEAVYWDVGKKLEKSMRYKESVKAIEDRIEAIDRKLMIEISDTITVIENEVQDAAYSQGFSDAVKLIMSCMNGG
jgi:hypothetical protein